MQIIIHITQSEFNKKVDQEYAYLTHQEGMSADKARQQATQTVSEKFQVQGNPLDFTPEMKPRSMTDEEKREFLKAMYSNPGDDGVRT